MAVGASEVSPGKCSLSGIKNLWEQLCCEANRRELTACEGSQYTKEEINVRCGKNHSNCIGGNGLDESSDL